MVVAAAKYLQHTNFIYIYTIQYDFFKTEEKIPRWSYEIKRKKNKNIHQTKNISTKTKTETKDTKQKKNYKMKKKNFLSKH